ncbi:MAG: TIGR01777 family oxidoreductase [Spirochaetes bacterium]|nr:TIGR01777 family oxidoreductase [Spirochaetota bacterium]
MKFFITGGLGFVGRKLSEILVRERHQVTVVERNPGGKPPPPPGVSVIAADASRSGSWQDILAQHDAVINLAGVSIFTRWSKSKKDEIYNSRILITRNVVDALKARKNKKTLFFSTSAVGYYGFHGDEAMTESSPSGDDFLARVCRDWEAEAMAAESYGVRVVITRFGVVLGRNGGALDVLSGIFRLRLGNRLGSGSQWFSWIHEDDLASLFLFLINNGNISGPFNCTSPGPVTNSVLTRALNKALGTIPLVPPAPGFLMKLALGEFGDFLLKGQKAVPQRLIEAGFGFTHTDIRKALADLCRKGGQPEGGS